MKRTHTIRIVLIGFLFTGLSIILYSQADPFISQEEIWPEENQTHKPWTRWWWMGSAVDPANITRILEEFSQAGLGGVEITPIYGVKGEEDQYIPYLSARWMEMLQYTLAEAERLGLGVDMVLGTGWPFGGPQVEKEFAAGKLHIQTHRLKAGKNLNQWYAGAKKDFPADSELQYLLAFDRKGNKRDLTSLASANSGEWIADKEYELYAVFLGKSGQQVKRAAPGGEGNVLDHFSEDALRDYLEPYEQTLGPVENNLRALFNDSYEVYNSDYTAQFFEEFKNRRGYDLTDHLSSVHSGSGNKDANRVLSDYRETLSDLLLEEFSVNWDQWAEERTFLTRYQAHGSPGNLLDIYATSDIPECESFYGTRFDIPGVRWEESDALEGHPDLIMLKFASSAAHISGKSLTSAETLTWLREHFKTALSQCKPEVEQLLLSGVNHVFFHGSTYSPVDAEWPGWKFYASVNFVPDSPLWKDAPSMFQYITRCQSMLQSGRSDNELLVYWPFYDVIGADHEGKRLVQLSIHNKDEWLVHTPFYQLVSALIEEGYSGDFISDRYLENAKVTDGKIELAGLEYSSLIVPECTHMPIRAFNSMARISKEGANVVFQAVPESVPGYLNYDLRSSQLKKLIAAEENYLNITRDIPGFLSEHGIEGERLRDTGLDFIRRNLKDGKIYYLVNHTPRTIDQYIPLNCQSATVMILNPLTGRAGLGSSKSTETGSEVYIQMKPGETLILRTFNEMKKAEDWAYFRDSGRPVEIRGNWNIEFVSGWPSLPDEDVVQELQTWTGLGEKAEAFSGSARYSIRIDNPDPGVTHWRLDLGDVRESARIWINDHYIGCSWSVPFGVVTETLREGSNTLVVEVTNLPANRLRDLERRGIEWKIFHEINMVNRHYKKFDATGWEPTPSGLLGPVTLTPQKEFHPE